jgi:hypothetical protein
MFNDEHLLQISGTAMGTKMTPYNAKIFMVKLERRFLHSPTMPLNWLLFIDDIEIKRVDGGESLTNFIDMANSFHNSIKFNVEILTSKNTFLFYTTSSLTNGEIEFNLHTKPTDSHLYLMQSSFRPFHASKSVPKDLATHIRRICSSNSFQEQENILKKTPY